MSYKSAYKRIPKTIKKCSPKAIKIKFSTGSFHMVLVIHQSISESSKGFSDFTNYPGVMTSIRTFKFIISFPVPCMEKVFLYNYPLTP